MQSSLHDIITLSYDITIKSLPFIHILINTDHFGRKVLINGDSPDVGIPFFLSKNWLINTQVLLHGNLFATKFRWRLPTCVSPPQIYRGAVREDLDIKVLSMLSSILTLGLFPNNTSSSLNGFQIGISSALVDQEITIVFEIKFPSFTDPVRTWLFHSSTNHTLIVSLKYFFLVFPAFDKFNEITTSSNILSTSMIISASNWKLSCFFLSWATSVVVPVLSIVSRHYLEHLTSARVTGKISFRKPLINLSATSTDLPEFVIWFFPAFY